ncbi:hypothetical protein [Stappia indica]|uniref:hypothetical protein n=1 Tax=Stappia indica TaxID=538381 RepID=UPI001CD21DE5|nr:hypothetical protein [Stappia indica]MCA1298050.1 hypothetical protein [Stappia indica]
MTADQLCNIRRPTGETYIVVEIGAQRHVISDRYVMAKLARQLAEALEGIAMNEAARPPPPR